MSKEIGRLLMSGVLMGMAGYLYHLGFGAPDLGVTMGATNVASAIISANLVYWLKPG